LGDGAPVMELDSFDLIVNLVSQGMGVSIVPRRVLPLYARRRVVKAVGFRPALRREVWVVVRKDRRRPKHISDFVESVLF
jgi:DNA-binding transcriptional LysR family regulator